MVKGTDLSIQFLSTLSLRRATWYACSMAHTARNFYPRSPCGERHRTVNVQRPTAEFLSTLSLRRATDSRSRRNDSADSISIHALLAESDLLLLGSPTMKPLFLSTLSLRRATQIPYPAGRLIIISIHALLAESDRSRGGYITKIDISIHALLAESDAFRVFKSNRFSISIHALLAESDCAVSVQVGGDV